jgi:hypothetical protein
MQQTNDIIKGLLLVFLSVILPLQIHAQDISGVPLSGLPNGGYIKGLYYIQADDGSGNYMKERPDGTFVLTPLDPDSTGFYFWIVENNNSQTFQIFSALQSGKLWSLSQTGTIQLVNDVSLPETQLFFRMYPEGPQKTTVDSLAGIVSIASIVTDTQPNYQGTAECECYGLQFNNGANIKFKIHDAGQKVDNYRPIAFEKADVNNTNGAIQEFEDHVVITQTASAIPYNNFVSSNFFVKGFGPDDFRLTIKSGTEGAIGFVDYLKHHYTSDIYIQAKPQIGIKVENDMISLIYLFGEQKLPLSQEKLGNEVLTGFVTDVPIMFGFLGQNKLVATQNNVTKELILNVPAELYFNQSITQNARMLVRLSSGEIAVSYTPKNYLINSNEDFGWDDGSGLTSTDAFFPYNAGQSLVNSFDWRHTQWQIRYYGDNGEVEENVFSPFYSNDLAFSSISAKFDATGKYLGGEDYVVTDGWELIKANLGYYADGSIKNLAPQYPYVILYDKISAKIRVFVYANNQGEANQLTISLGMDSGSPGTLNEAAYTPKLWGSLQQTSALEKTENSSYKKPIPFKSTAGRDWYFADFIMEYDPCVNFFESSIQLHVYKTTRGDLTIVGRVEGGIIPAGTAEYDEWKNKREKFLLGVMDNDYGQLENTLGDITFDQYQTYDILDFQNEINGTLVGSDIEPWAKEKARIEWAESELQADLTIVDGALTIAEGAAIIAGAASGPIGESFAQGAQGAITIAQGANTIVRGKSEQRLAYANKLYYDNIKDKIKEDDQSIKLPVPPPRPQVLFGELALKGTLRIETTLISAEFIATPGGLNSENSPEWYVNGSRGSNPLYNKTMGNYTLLKQPEFGIAVTHDPDKGYQAYLKIKERPYFAHNNEVIGKIDDVLAMAINIQTLDGKKVMHRYNGESYTTLFDTPEGNSLPGFMDITDLVDWNQISTNIGSLSDQSVENIQAQLSTWINVSYHVWSLTLTNYKSRNLSRVFANAVNYFDGQTSYAYHEEPVYSVYELKQKAKELADIKFATYSFGDDFSFGNKYHMYSSQTDFYSLMNTYCTVLSTKTSGGTGTRESVEELIVESQIEPGLSVFPNPSSSTVNFNLASDEKGKVGIALYDFLGRKLIATTDIINGRDILQGRIDISVLNSGTYILKVVLPSGKFLSKKIIKR